MLPLFRKCFTFILLFFGFFIFLFIIFPRTATDESYQLITDSAAHLANAKSLPSLLYVSKSSSPPLTPLELAFIQQHFFCENSMYITNPTAPNTGIPASHYHKVTIDTFRNPFEMNVFNEGDIVSGTIESSKVWERENSEALLAVMSGVNPFEIRKMITENSFVQMTSNPDKEAYFLDIGSNVGWFSLLMAAHNFPTISFEPMKVNEIMFRQSICLNSPEMQSNLLYFHYALGEQPSVCAMYSDINNQGDGHVKCINNVVSQKDTASNSDLAADNSQFPIKSLMIDPKSFAQLSSNMSFGRNYIYRNMITIVKLDDILLPFFNMISTIRKHQDIFPADSPFAYAPEQIRLMKIDTEGYEYQAFLGARELLAQKRVRYIFSEFSPRMLSEKSGGSAPDDYLRFFWDLGYTVRQIRKNFDVSRVVTEDNKNFCGWLEICELFILHNEDQ